VNSINLNYAYASNRLYYTWGNTCTQCLRLNKIINPYSRKTFHIASFFRTCSQRTIICIRGQLPVYLKWMQKFRLYSDTIYTIFLPKTSESVKDLWSTDNIIFFFFKGTIFWNITPCQPSTWRYIPENCTLHNHCCENLKSYFFIIISQGVLVIYWFILIIGIKSEDY
jgi:hypothetical protein